MVNRSRYRSSTEGIHSRQSTRIYEVLCKRWPAEEARSEAANGWTSEHLLLFPWHPWRNGPSRICKSTQNSKVVTNNSLSLSLTPSAEDTDSSSTWGTHVSAGQVHGPRTRGTQVRSKVNQFLITSSFGYLGNAIIRSDCPSCRLWMQRKSNIADSAAAPPQWPFLYTTSIKTLSSPFFLTTPLFSGI